MSKLEICEKVNSLGERITHFSKSGSIAKVSYNHSDREIAVKIDDVWLPVATFVKDESEVFIKTKIVKALNCLADVVKMINSSSDEKWDKFILAYESET